MMRMRVLWWGWGGGFEDLGASWGGWGGVVLRSGPVLGGGGGVGVKTRRLHTRGGGGGREGLYPSYAGLGEEAGRT